MCGAFFYANRFLSAIKDRGRGGRQSRSEAVLEEKSLKNRRFGA